MTQTNAPAPALKQLKKNDFLAAVTETPMTRGQLVEALDGYTYIGTYLDYLIDHFSAQNKIVKLEDGSIQRKGKKPVSSGVRGIFRVELDDDGVPHLAHKDSAYGEKMDKESGWAVTEKRAVKNYCSRVHADYLAKTKAAKALLVEAEEGGESDDESGADVTS